MKRLAAPALAALAVVAPASAGLPVLKPKPVPSLRDHARLTVQPGQIVRWRSHNIGRVDRLSLHIGGREAFYSVEPRTRSCVAYGYEAGVAIRITDCRKGRRVPYVRVRAVSAALKPVTVVLRLN